MYRTDIQVRFCDTDALGHINNVSFAAYAESGRIDFLARLGKSVTSLILANLVIDYRRQVKFGEPVHVDTWVGSLGRSSITLLQTVWANGEVAADIQSVVVHFDYPAGVSAELTQHMRDELAPFVKPKVLIDLP